MTVRMIGSGADDGPLVFCDWFVETEGKSGHFPPTSLDKVEKRPDGSGDGGGGGGSWMGR